MPGLNNPMQHDAACAAEELRDIMRVPALLVGVVDDCAYTMFGGAAAHEAGASAEAALLHRCGTSQTVPCLPACMHACLLVVLSTLCWQSMHVEHAATCRTLDRLDCRTQSFTRNHCQCRASAHMARCIK
jgi:hypothetical protein